MEPRTRLLPVCLVSPAGRTWGPKKLMAGYIPILMFILVAAAFPLATLVLARVVRPSNPDPVKGAAYECGVEAAGEARGRYSVAYYVIAVLFVVFDVEVIFFYPYAINFRELGQEGFLAVVLFVAFFLCGFIYIMKKGALKWED